MARCSSCGAASATRRMWATEGEASPVTDTKPTFGDRAPRDQSKGRTIRWASWRHPAAQRSRLANYRLAVLCGRGACLVGADRRSIAGADGFWLCNDGNGGENRLRIGMAVLEALDQAGQELCPLVPGHSYPHNCDSLQRLAQQGLFLDSQRLVIVPADANMRREGRERWKAVCVVRVFDELPNRIADGHLLTCRFPALHKKRMADGCLDRDLRGHQCVDPVFRR